MTADPLAAALARTREQLRRAEDEIAVLRADNARLRARQTADVELPEQIAAGIAEAHAGQTIDLGDFTQYVTPVMTPEQQARFDADHTDGPTPGCDCGHDGMGRAWHARDCEWRIKQKEQGHA